MNRRDAIRAAAAAATGLATGTSPILGTTVDRSATHTTDLSGQPAPEILLRGGRIINADGGRFADIRILGERITEIGPDLVAGLNTRVVDTTGHLVMPGGIDPHTHLQGSFIDNLTSGTSAALAGGVTTVGTFAYSQGDENAIEAMDRWIAEVPKKAIGDVFFHASSWPPTSEFADMMPELAARGQPSHKIFMTRSDYGERRREVIQVLEAARDAGVVTLMHCEDSAILDTTLENKG